MAVRLITAEEIEALPEPERSEKLEKLRLLAQIREENPLQFFHCCPTHCGLPGCHPHPKQHEFMLSRDRIKAFFGGNQSGKSTSAVVDTLVQAVDEDCLPDRLKVYKQYKPPFFARIITPDATSTRDVILEKIREWVPKHQLSGGGFDTAYEKARAVLAFSNGSRLDFKTNEQERDKHGGATLHRIVYDEEPDREIRMEARIRVMKHQGDELFAMTPLKGMSWLLDEVWERRHEDGITAVQVDMTENPWLDKHAIGLALDGLTSEEVQARKEGRFVHFAGLVYPEFHDDTHVCQPPEIAQVRSWDTIVGIDPGIRATAVTWHGFDNENRVVTYDELLLSNDDAIPENAASKIRAKNKLWGIDPDFYVIDPSARNRALTNAESVEAAYQRAGIYCVHGQNAVEAGVFEVKRRLQHTPALLTISRTCQRLLWEIARYRIDDSADGQFKVVKAHDHAVDSLRYALMARPFPFETLDTPRVQRTPQGQAPKFRWQGPQVPTAPTGALT